MNFPLNNAVSSRYIIDWKYSKLHTGKSRSSRRNDSKKIAKNLENFLTRINSSRSLAENTLKKTEKCCST